LSLGFRLANAGIQDSNNLSAEKAPGNVDVPQRFVVSYNWELPFGPGRAFLNTPGFLAKVVGGWQLNGITTAQRGSAARPDHFEQPDEFPRRRFASEQQRNERRALRPRGKAA
jgi:hypothetical protein